MITGWSLTDAFARLEEQEERNIYNEEDNNHLDLSIGETKWIELARLASAQGA